ncbi:MAG TPA: exosortase/archaeosortase family protein, partial [Chthoniobacterales bacterium]
MNSVTTQPQMTSRVQMVAAALALGALWFVLCRQLSGEWSVNEQYSYGWFVPFFAAFLFWLRWEDRPAGPGPTEAPSSKLQASSSRGTGAMAVGILALLILFPVRLFEVANPDWRPLGWIHAAAVVALTLVVIWAAGGRPWVRHFAFPVCFILVAVPWITPIEEPIVQGLMRTVAALATETITLFGVPAQVEGNLIRVSTGLVGVNEACSGVRSLQTSLMIGLLFGELKRLSLGKRWLLVIGAIVLALLANFGRALFLIWIAATESVSAVDRWHDIAGYAIVALVFCGSLALAVALAKGERRKTLATAEPVHGEGGEGGNEKEKPETTLPFILPPSAFILSFAWLLAIEIGVEGWYRAHEKQLVDQPGWSVRPPREAPAFREIKIDENVRRTLQFDAGREVVWKNIGEKSPGSATTNYLFFFRWNPGSSSVLRARAHRPDLCLPSVGWTLLADRGPRSYQAASGIQIAARHVVFKGQTNAIAHTFFCLQEDKIHPSEREANEPAAP